MGNKSILIGGTFILAMGTLYAIQKKKPVTPVLTGGIAFLLLSSVLDMFGGNWSKFSESIVWLAVTSSIIAESPTILDMINKKVGK